MIVTHATSLSSRYQQPNWTKVAEAYGQGVTYDSVQGFSRKLKAKVEARKKEMEAEATNGKAPVASVTPSPAKGRGKRKNDNDGARDAKNVKNGGSRITKKAKTKAASKQNEDDEDVAQTAEGPPEDYVFDHETDKV
jgi:hypothetical protein